MKMGRRKLMKKFQTKMIELFDKNKGYDVDHNYDLSYR